MFVVATATFYLLYGLIVLSLDRRRVVHFVVTQIYARLAFAPNDPRPSRGTPHPAIYCEIETHRMVQRFAIAFARWASRRSSQRREACGRTRKLSVSSVRSVGNVWVTSSSSTSAICVPSYRAILNIMMMSEPIFRSTRTVRDLVAYNLPRVGGLHHRYERRAA